MGASGWNYIVPYQPDIARVLSDLQHQVFDQSAFWEGYDGEWATESLDDLVALKETDEFWEEGTHSILDIDQIIDTGQPDTAGAVRALTADETRALFGSDRPARTDFKRVSGDHSIDMDAEFPRWSGRYVILYQEGKPNEVAFWGYSGD